MVYSVSPAIIVEQGLVPIIIIIQQNLTGALGNTEKWTETSK